MNRKRRLGRSGYAGILLSKLCSGLLTFDVAVQAYFNSGLFSMLSVFPVFRHHSRKDWGERRNCDVRKDLWDCYKGQGRNWPIADRRVPSNHPRNNCGTHFCSSSPLVSKVAKTAFFLSCLFIFWAEEGESGGV